VARKGASATSSSTAQKDTPQRPAPQKPVSQQAISRRATHQQPIDPERQRLQPAVPMDNRVNLDFGFAAKILSERNAYKGGDAELWQRMERIVCPVHDVTLRTVTHCLFSCRIMTLSISCIPPLGRRRARSNTLLGILQGTFPGSV